MNAKKAFTFIELLAVILFPVFAQAKLAAKKTPSLSNNKRTGLALPMYLGDADDRLRGPVGVGGPLPSAWAAPSSSPSFPTRP